MSDPTPLERPKFDEHAARRVAERHDRDSAPYFAGRAKEIEAFEAAIRNAREATAAVFRIYQGAPGCGKTSLAKHLEHTCELRALVVSFTHDETFDREALARKVKNQVISRNKISKSLAAIGEFAATTLRNQELSREAQEEFARNRIKDECLVVHIDEAHAMPDSFKLLLVGLHVQRPGVPCVVLLTGLGHTAEVVTGHAGLSRIAGDTVVQMGGMSKGECAESTWKMLRELRPHGPDEQKARLAELTAELSFGWPQHLNIAQKSLCEELLRTNGQAEPVDTRRMARKTAARRAEYYERRIQHPRSTAIQRSLTGCWPELPATRTFATRTICGRSVPTSSKSTDRRAASPWTRRRAGSLVKLSVKRA